MALTTRRANACQHKRRAGLLSTVGVLSGALIGVAVIVAFPDSHVHALKAAGEFKGTPISGVQTFVEKIQGSLVWLGITCAGLALAVISLMFLAGHSRAHDYAFRTFVGLAILASISGLVA